jgi:hypothetical protein
MPSAQNQIQIVDTHETSETLAITRLQRVGYQINRTLLLMINCNNNMLLHLLDIKRNSSVRLKSEQIQLLSAVRWFGCVGICLQGA